MADLTTAYRNAVANYLRGGGAPTAISGIFLDLFNGDPQGAGSSVLATLTGSATRPNITSAIGAASGGASTNAAQIDVEAAADAGATITHLAVYDAATSGNLIWSDALTGGNQVITTGNPIVIPANGLTLTVA